MQNFTSISDIRETAINILVAIEEGHYPRCDCGHVYCDRNFPHEETVSWACGVRETLETLGQHQITEEDVLNARQTYRMKHGVGCSE